MNKPSFCMGHILIKVADLPSAVKAYEQLGFKVVPGMPKGRGSKEAANYKILFSDFSFLELFVVPRSRLLSGLAGAMNKLGYVYGGRLANYLRCPNGLCDLALNSEPESSFDKNLSLLRQQGLKLHGPRQMVRQSLKGVDYTWTLYYPKDWRVPFIISPYTPPLRPEAHELDHRNGAAYIKSLEVETISWDQHFAYYKAITRKAAQIKLNNGMRCCSFSLGRAELVLKESNQDRLTHLVLAGQSVRERQHLDEQLTQGVSITLEPD